jgi:hypothetical protein
MDGWAEVKARGLNVLPRIGMRRVPQSAGKTLDPLNFDLR